MPERPRLVGYRHVIDGDQVHILQGGGPACPGWYFDRTTWCGIEERSPSIDLVPTSKAPTCPRCIDAEQAEYKERNAIPGGTTFAPKVEEPS